MITSTQTWKKVKFADFVDTNPKSPLKKNNKYPFIPMELVDGVSKNPTSFYTKKFTGGGSRFSNGDTVFAKITPCLENGKIAQIKDLPDGIGFGSTEFFVFRSKEGISDKDFVYYLSRTDDIRSPAIKSMIGASGRQRADKSVVENLDVLAPSITDQRRISDVLSAYDDLIENNARRIKILEQMAQAIYTEWFVNFHFPDYEKVKIIDSGTDFGKIPEGWRIGKLSDLANITMGQSPSSDFYNESGDGLPFHQGVTNFGFRFPTTVNFSTGGTRRANAGDVLFSVRAPVGRINVADRNMIIGRGLSAMRSTSESQSYLLCTLKNLFTTEDLIGGGAIFASVTRADLNNFPVVIPDAKVISFFEELISPFDGLIFDISRNLSVLRHSRDLLLPKLVTGEIRV